MAKKYDLEDLLDKVEEILKAKLNDKIAAIEAEKASRNKGVQGGLAPVAASAYYRQSWNEKILNDKVAIYYGVGSITPLDGGPDTAETIKIFVEVVFVDSGQTNDSHARVFRYARAIKEVAKENFGNLGFGSQTAIETVVPVSITDAGTSEEMKIGGIQITTSIA